MDQVPFTVNPLRVLKNTSGLKNELVHSKIIHSQKTALLVSSLILRSRNLGQIDIAIIGKEIVVYEVKSSLQGSYLHYSQALRLKNALGFLSLIFAKPGRLKVLK